MNGYQCNHSPFSLLLLLIRAKKYSPFQKENILVSYAKNNL